VTSLTGSMPWSRPIRTTEECPKRGPKCTLVARDRSVGLTMTKLLVGTWVLTCGFVVGAGDENRTRMSSLGSEHVYGRAARMQ